MKMPEPVFYTYAKAPKFGGPWELRDHRYIGVFSMRPVQLFTADQLEAYAAAKVAEERERLEAEIVRLTKERDDYERRWLVERQAVEATISGGRYPDGKPAW